MITASCRLRAPRSAGGRYTPRGVDRAPLMKSQQSIAIDVVINNYNYGSYVCDAVDSACQQDYPHVNVVVVDDGSTDDSRQRLRAYDGVVDLVLKDNEGQSAALNAGFARCGGDAVMFLDADDVLAPMAARRAAAVFAAEPRAARVQFRMGLIDADGRALGRTRPPPHRPMPSGDLRRAELAFPFDLTCVAMSGNAFRAGVLERVMPIPELDYGRWGADYYLVHLTTLLGVVVSLEDVGAFYRVHGRNAFEPAAPVLDLDRVRREIIYQQKTIEALSRLADELGLDRPDPILSLSNIANRIISHRLAPELHPVRDDRCTALMASAMRAAARRYDVSLLMRVLLLASLGAIAASPPPIAAKLAELLVFPELREPLTRLLGRMDRKGKVVARPWAVD